MSDLSRCVTTRIDFFLLPTEQDRKILYFACRFAEKAWSRRHTLFIYTKNLQESHDLNEQLWSFKAESFIPHVVWQKHDIVSKNVVNSVVISDKLYDFVPCHFDILMNFREDVVPEFWRFQRIVHVLSSKFQCLQNARATFKFYRQQGILPHSEHIHQNVLKQ